MTVHVQELSPDVDQIAHYKAIRERIKNAQPRPRPVLVKAVEPEPAPFLEPLRILPPIEPPREEGPQGRSIYAWPIGPRTQRDVLYVASPVEGKVTLAHQIIREVCAKHGVTKSEMMSMRRRQALVLAKREVCFRLKRETQMSFPHIGFMLGGKDHTTILYNFYKYLEENPGLVEPGEVAGLESWRKSTAANLARNQGYWARSRAEREKLRRDAKKPKTRAEWVAK